MKILYLTPRFPWPLLRGDQLRAFEQLRLLAKHHRLSLVCFEEEPPAAEGRAAVGALCESVRGVKLTRAAMAAGLARGALSPLPFQASLYRQRSMQRALRDALAGGPFDLVHVQLARMAPYVEPLQAVRFVDFVDALSLSTRRRSAQHRGPLRWLSGLEAARLLRYERRLCATLEGACVASPVDREAIGDFPRLGVAPNGVDLARLPFLPGGREPRTLVFTGNMGYFSNVNAVEWFVHSVFPLVRERLPDARFAIVGARPAPAVRALAGREGVSVLGFVEDLREHLRRAAVAVAPMRAGAGQQFKVLEAMASGTPVVATPVAAAGLRPEADCLLVAEGAQAFADAVVALLGDEALAARVATRARRFVEERYTWEHSTALLEEQYEAARARR